MRRITASRLLAFAMLPALAVAASSATAQTSPAEAVLACARLTEGMERLACYDRTVPGLRAGAGTALAAPTAAPAQAAAAQAAAAPAAPQGFGAEQIPTPRAKAAAEGQAEAEDEVLSARVAKIGADTTSGKRDRMMITLDNGQVWVQRESKKFMLRTGDAVTIKPAILGTYNLVRDGSNAILKVRRVQ